MYTIHGHLPGIHYALTSLTYCSAACAISVLGPLHPPPGQVLCLEQHTPPGCAQSWPPCHHVWKLAAVPYYYYLAAVPLHIAGPCALYIMLTHVPLLPGPCASYFAFQPLCLVHYVWLHLRCRSLCESRLYSVLRTSCRRLSFKDFLAPIQPYAYRALFVPRAWRPGRGAPGVGPGRGPRAWAPGVSPGRGPRAWAPGVGPRSCH